MHIQDFFQNFLKFFLVGLHGDCTINLIAQDMSCLKVARFADADVAAAATVDAAAATDDLLHPDRPIRALQPPHQDPNPNNRGYLALVTARGGGGSLMPLEDGERGFLRTASEERRVTMGLVVIEAFIGLQHLLGLFARSGPRGCSVGR